MSCLGQRFGGCARTTRSARSCKAHVVCLIPAFIPLCSCKVCWLIASGDPRRARLCTNHVIVIFGRSGPPFVPAYGYAAATCSVFGGLVPRMCAQLGRGVVCESRDNTVVRTHERDVFCTGIDRIIPMRKNCLSSNEMSFSLHPAPPFPLPSAGVRASCFSKLGVCHGKRNHGN